MNIKLNRKQRCYLTYLSLGAHVDVCTSVGRAFGCITSNNPQISESIQAALNSFYTWGLLQEEEFEAFGIRWSRLTISEKGRELISTIGERDE